MTVLSKELVEKFYLGLIACRTKSDFDENLLQKNSLEQMYRLTLEQWVAIFKNRLHVSIGTVFDWTLIGIESGNNWANSKKHSNYHWFALAGGIASLSESHIAKVLFPDVDIALNDLEYLSSAQSFSSLIFNDSLNRLALIQRIFKGSETDACSYRSYDKSNNEYPISPFEAYQINRKISHPKISNYFCIINWSQFRGNYLDVWNAMTDKYPLDEIVYPLFRIVRSYFKALENHQNIDSTLSLVNSFYTEVFSKLSIEQVNSIYGQRIGKTDLAEPIYLYEVFLSLMCSQSNPSDSLATMVKFAVWITHLNPAMVIDHPLVNDHYDTDRIGPFFTQAQLANELARLLHFRGEFDEEDLIAIQQLCDNLSREALVEKELFIRFWIIFAARDEYNHTETFTDINKSGILTGSYEYVYYRKGANAQFIRIAQILSGMGVLKRCGVDDYYQLLMPSLASPVDSVTGELLSFEHLSHYARPEKNRTYLIFLGNSKNNYIHNNHCFYNVNAEKVVPFTLKEYESIQAYSSNVYHKYPRIPKFTTYPLTARTLRELVHLVNHSLNYEAAQDGDGYVLREGLTKNYLQEKIIEYAVDTKFEELTYRVKDSWNHDTVYTGKIQFSSVSEQNAFSKGTSKQRLLFILHAAVNRGHARSNLSMAKYFKAYDAYDRFREYCRQLEENHPDEFWNLNHVSMRYGITVRSFSEVWKKGFPGCMSAASKWFSTFILDYLPGVLFRDDIEYNKQFNEYLEYARRDSQHLYQYYHSEEAAIRLSSELTHVSVQTTTIAGLKEKGMRLFGVEDQNNLAQKFTNLLLIADNEVNERSFSLFKSNKRSHAGYPTPLPVTSSKESSLDLTDTEDSSSMSSSVTSIVNYGSMFSSSKKLSNSSTSSTPRSTSTDDSLPLLTDGLR